MPTEVIIASPFEDRPEQSPVPFQQTFRLLARHGAALWGAFFDRHSGLGKILKNLAGTEDQVLQFVRHDPNYAFPWTALYDFKLPAEIAGPWGRISGPSDIAP